MQCVKKSVLVEYSAMQMYELVDRVEDYPRFLPWCAGARVLDLRPDGKTARLDIDYHGVRTSFTTDNANTPGALIVVTLKDGPFRHLHGEWRFLALRADACKVSLDMSYEFSSGVLDRVIGPVFNHIATTFIDAFVRRAQTVYGVKGAA